MKDKFLLSAALAGLLQAVLLFLTMDLFYWSTVSDLIYELPEFFFWEHHWFFPCILAVLFGGCYAAPMLLFTKKRNWLWYFLCSIGFFLLFVAFFFTVAYVLPSEIAYMPPELMDENIPSEFAGLIFGLVLLLFSFPYFVFIALAKLVAHLVFVAIWLVRLIRQRRATTL